MIFDIITSQNPAELIKSLNEFINSQENSRVKNEMLRDLRQQLMASVCIFRGDQPIEVLQGRASIRAYLLKEWDYKDTYRENRKEILRVIQGIEQNVTGHLDNSGDGIKAYERTMSFMQHLNDRFSLLNKLPQNSSLKFYLIELMRPPVPEMFHLESNPLDENIFLFYPMDMDFQKYEYNLAIQMGHFLRSKLTQGTGAPESFAWLREVMFSKKDQLSPQECNELFAICFAIAALRNSKYVDQDPNDFIHEDDKRILSSYMSALIKSQGDISKQEFAKLIEGKPHIDLSGKHLS